ncbi:hypothetical protein [Caenimonas sp. SL110]|uniref:hypothetical protein n=1 Tax=Caenimonas sp. SL110 TaxID=1450524 RepID=UPI000653F49C|nr:hypothetical protein [Caenimonas sp. SL110]
MKLKTSVPPVERPTIRETVLSLKELRESQAHNDLQRTDTCLRDWNYLHQELGSFADEHLTL